MLCCVQKQLPKWTNVALSEYMCVSTVCSEHWTVYAASVSFEWTGSVRRALVPKGDTWKSRVRGAMAAFDGSAIVVEWKFLELKVADYCRLWCRL